MLTSGGTPDPLVADPDFALYVGDVREVLRALPDESVDCCVTSPPYWGLRDYGRDLQIGLEESPEAYVAEIVAVFREVRRLLVRTGSLWVNLGDSYNAYNGNRGDSGSTLQGRSQVVGRPRVPARSGRSVKSLKPKDLVGMPWRVAFALQSDGWFLRSDIVWSKPNPMPESVTDRPTKSHEYVFLLTKSRRYYFNADAVREPHSGRASGNGARFVPPDGHSIRNYHQGRGIPWSPGAEDDPDALTLGDLPAEAPRGPDGRRKTVHDHSTADGHENYSQIGDGRERWPNAGGRNVRSVWEIATKPYADAHFATFPEELPRRCVAAGCPEGGVVLDPFLGSGTTALVARKMGRRAIGVELNSEYADLAARRLQQLSLFAE